MEDTTNWVLELEEALLDEAPPQEIKMLLAGWHFKKNGNESMRFIFMKADHFQPL